MSLQELERWLALEIAGAYHNKPHKGLEGLTPLQAWQQAWTSPSGQALIPPLIGDARNFVLGFLPSVQRLVGREGISLYGLKFWDPALTPFINSHVEHRVHFDQRDLTRVYLHCAGEYIDIPLKDRTRGPFSLWELKEVRGHLKSMGRKARDESQLFETLEQQRQIQQEAASKSKAARKKVARRPPVTTASAPAVDYSESVEPLSLDEAEVA